MEDKYRISKTLFYLNILWQKKSYIPFNQFIHDLQWQFNEAHEGEMSDKLYRKHIDDASITFKQADVVDLYDVEDELFLEFLKEKVKQLRAENK